MVHGIRHDTQDGEYILSLAMPLRKSLITLLLCLTFQVAAIAAEQRTAAEDMHNIPVGYLCLSEDITVQLAGILPKNSFGQWLLKLLFIAPQSAEAAPTPLCYQPYAGKVIGQIQLDKQGGFGAYDAQWKPAWRLITTTRDSVILRKLSFAQGDAIVPEQLLAAQQRLKNLPWMEEAKITLREKEAGIVDVHIATQDRFPISLALDPDESSSSFGYNNVLGWGHVLQHQCYFEGGWAMALRIVCPICSTQPLLGRYTTAICAQAIASGLGFLGDLPPIPTMLAGFR